MKGKRTAYKPTSAVLSADRDLLSFESDTTHPLSHVATPSGVTGAGYIPTNTPYPNSYAGNVSGAGSATVNAASTPSISALPVVNAYDSFTVQFTIDAKFPNGAQRACIMVPNSSTKCEFQFSVNSSDLLPNQSFQAKVYAANGNPGDFLFSNTISYRRGGVQKISNTSGGVNDTVSNVTAMGNLVFFFAKTSLGGLKLFKTDGLTVSQVSNTSTSNSTNDVTVNNPPAVYHDELFFFALNATGNKKLYKTNGTSVVQISNTTNSQVTNDATMSWNTYLVVYKDALYFTAYNTNVKSKLHRYDGTKVEVFSNAAQDVTLHDDPYDVIAIGDYLYFTAYVSPGAGNRIKIFCTDGTSAVQVSNTSGASNNDDMFGVGQLGATTFFFGLNTSNKLKLYKINGGNVVLVLNRLGASVDDYAFAIGDRLTPLKQTFNNYFYFSAYETTGNYKLYRTDGTVVTKVMESVAGGNDRPEDFTVFGNFMYFSAQVSPTVRKLFRTDGTLIEMVSNTSGDIALTDAVSGVSKIGNHVYFSANNSSGYKKLFRTDGTTITQVSQINPTNDSIYEKIDVNGVLYFTADDSSGYRSLYRLIN